MNLAAGAIQICSVDDVDGHLRLDKAALDALLKPYENKRLLVISCVGALRGGKSTLLSWLVRKAEQQQQQRGKAVFPTAWGRKPCTSGIWGRIVDRADDENTCWLFLDTQGLFDGQLNVASTSHLFGVCNFCLLSMYWNNGLTGYNFFYFKVNFDCFLAVDL